MLRLVSFVSTKSSAALPRPHASVGILSSKCGGIYDLTSSSSLSIPDMQTLIEGYKAHFHAPLKEKAHRIDRGEEKLIDAKFTRVVAPIIPRRCSF